MSVKVKNVNGYIRKNGKKVVRIELENGSVAWIPEGLLAYACQTAKPVKDKAVKENKLSPEVF